MSFGPNPWQQQHWDWRAAGNFMGGGAGSGLIVFAGLSSAAAGTPRWWMLAAGALLVGLGLSSVWLEIGRPWRALNVFLNARSSWMTREAMVAPLLFAAVAASLTGLPGAPLAAALLGLAFVYCQGRLLQAAKGIPAWREPLLVPLIVATGLAEGGGLFLLLSALSGTGPLSAGAGLLPPSLARAAGFAPGPLALWSAFALALLARLALWFAWRGRLGATTAPRALAALDRAGSLFKAATLLPLVAAVVVFGAPLDAAAALVLQAAAGALAAAGGLWFKFTLVTRGAFNQGFALARLPVRGMRRSP